MLNSTFAGDKFSKKLIEKGLPTKRKLKLSPFRLAIIDLGTNSVRVDVYRINGKRVLRTYRRKIMIRLGDDVFKTGRLSPEGMKRAMKAFLGFKRLFREMRVDRVAAFGTSALRSASNTKEFLAELNKRTGVQIKVISGRDEGKLIAYGIISNMPAPKSYYALIDIGGGSTEVSLCLGKKVVSGYSFKLGANRLQQMFLQTIPPNFKKGELHPVLALRQHLKTELYPLALFVKKHPISFAIGSSGTIRTIGKILKKIGLAGQPILRAELSALVAEMQVMRRKQLKSIPGLEANRVDLILPGAILLEEILYAIKSSRLAVTDLALRDGILLKELESRFTG
ncbi:MAG: hypothetical protein A2Z20_11755 [Bdellovibrionales bacterium RBG_16_40_8]|nr:MAG: hypothetical protein A2Z20_11755 [Bdellovibrionales bacterium RBG_16_40_8]